MTESRDDRYRHLFVQIGEELARALIDRLQVLALTQPDTLSQVQRHVAELACEVVNTVTHMGWQFPGSTGPGMAIWKDQSTT